MTNLNINRTNTNMEGAIALGLFLDESESNKVLMNGKEVLVEAAITIIDDVEKFISDDEVSCTVVINNKKVRFEFI